MSSAPAPSALAVAEAIARIEERRDALDLLAARGMEVVERIAAGEKVEIPGRKPFPDAGRAFAVVTRAVRLCLALASRLDEVLIVLLRGGPIPDLAILKPEPTSPTAVPEPDAATPQAEIEAELPTDTETGAKTRVARAVDAVIEAEVEDPDASERMRSYVGERLVEGEDYDRMLHRPWREVVQAICADLGLRPDWTAWNNDTGFRAIRPLREEPPAPREVRPPRPAMATEVASRGTGPP